MFLKFLVNREYFMFSIFREMVIQTPPHLSFPHCRLSANVLKDLNRTRKMNFPGWSYPLPSPLPTRIACQRAETGDSLLSRDTNLCAY